MCGGMHMIGFSKKTRPEDRRRYPRFDVLKPGKIYVGDRSIPCLVVDISKEGIRVSTKLHLDIMGRFMFQFKDDDNIIRGEAEVVFGMPSYESEVYGCRLVSIIPYNYVKKYEKWLKEESAGMK